MKPYGDYPDLKQVRRILVVKLRHLGDVLLSTPVMSNLKRYCPGAKIDVLVYGEAREILEGHPDVSELLFVERGWKKHSLFKRLFFELQLLRKIRKNQYDLVINLTEGDRGAIVGFVSGAKIRVGQDQGRRHLFFRKIYTHRVKPCSTPRHRVERDLDALRCMGIFPTQEERQLFFAVPKEATVRMAPYRGAIVVHAVSRWRFKCWPLESVRALLSQLLEQNLRVVLTSGKDPVEVELLEGLPCSDNLAGKLSLKEMGALIQGARLCITIDSLPLHLASAFKTPLIALFGPSSEVNWGPWMHPKARVVAQNYSCRPCNLDGCGGSKVSDCLVTLPVKRLIQLQQELMQQSSSESEKEEYSESEKEEYPELSDLGEEQLESSESSSEFTRLGRG